MLSTDRGTTPPGRRAAELEVAFPNRKKSLTLSFTMWSNRTPVESSEPGLDQLPMNWAKPFVASCSPLGMGTGNAFTTGCSAMAAGLLPDGQGPVPRIQRSGTKPGEAGCGLAKRNPSYDTKKNVLSFPLYTPGILNGPPNVPPKSFCRIAGSGTRK